MSICTGFNFPIVGRSDPARGRAGQKLAHWDHARESHRRREAANHTDSPEQARTRSSQAQATDTGDAGDEARAWSTRMETSTARGNKQTAWPSQLDARGGMWSQA